MVVGVVEFPPSAATSCWAETAAADSDDAIAASEVANAANDEMTLAEDGAVVASGIATRTWLP